MKKVTFLFLILIVIKATGFSQGCLPQGITFNTQEQIDNFQTNYPGCTEIEGNVEIYSSYIYNLDSLYVLTSIGGTLLIKNSYNLSNLNGLHNLYSVGGDFKIKNMNNLTNFEGLNNLSSVGGDFDIEGNNYDLINFEGLSNLSSVGGDFTIEDNYYLTNFEGLGLLSSVGGNFHIEDNYHLVNFEGLNSLSSISGDLKIEHNNNLTSLIGLDNVNPASIQHLNITRNNSLSTCHIESICQYLANPNGKITIYLNAEGCNSPPQIASNCGITLPCLPFGDYYFFTQSEIDNFQTSYPGCTEIEGNVEISGDDITNLNGLNVLTTISGELLIQDNSSLVDLTGLESLTAIGWNLRIGSWNQNYQALTSLTGLDNLTSVGESVMIINNGNLTNLFASNSLTSIGELYIISNNMLTELTGLDGIYGGIINLNISNNASLLSIAGLDNIASVGYIASIKNNDVLSSIENLGNLQSVEWFYITDNPALTGLSGLDNLSAAYALIISNNDALTSLSGLENIEPETLCCLHISDNNVLTTCHIQSICDYLLSPNGIISIQNNATGCNSPEEVEEACLTITDEFAIIEDDIQIFPNPAKKTITIVSSSEVKIKQVIIFNQTGLVILQKKSPVNKIDVSTLQPGLYFVEVVTELGNVRKKLIVE